MSNEDPHLSPEMPDWLAKHNYIDSALLFGEQREVVIKHNNEWYRLQITKSNKLILTK